MKPIRAIRNWFVFLGRVFAREWSLVLRDQGVLIFFIILPLSYPIVYTLIYNPELVRKVDVAVVDEDRTIASRKLTNDILAAPAFRLYDYAADMGEAKRMMAEGKVYGILRIPHDYGKKIGRMETATAEFYSEMSLLLRYRSFFSSLSEVQVKEITDITAERSRLLGRDLGGMPYSNNANFLGDTEQGFASFIMPGIIILILQQSMCLGIFMLMGNSRERRRHNGGLDPFDVAGAPSTAVIVGRALCYSVFYIPVSIYILHYIPEWFSLPHAGSAVQYLLFIFPFILCVSFFGQTVGFIIKDRESVFPAFVVTSVLFLFLSGLTWPRYAFPYIWKAISDFVPATWGVEGFISINNNAATLADMSTDFGWLWGLTALFFVTSLIARRCIVSYSRRAYGALPVPSGAVQKS